MKLEPLTQSEFEKHLENKTLRLAFVGMSNAGKSYRARVLQNDCDFMWYNIDGEIQKTLGLKSMEEISEWLGYPNNPTYPERERAYLEAENKHTMIDFLDTHGKNLVSDSTGSVIYLKEHTHNWLEENCLLVNIEVDKNSTEKLITKYFDNPKPLIWSGFFKQNEGESQNEALSLCYPKLLLNRLEKYRQMSHLNIPAEKFYDKSGQETLSIIKSYLQP